MDPILPSLSDPVATANAEARFSARGVIDAWFNLSSSRVRFLKSLPLGSTVLDLGAGDGSLALFKGWLEPLRPDLKLYAVSLERGEHFSRYDGYELLNFDHEEPRFPGVAFNAIHSINFVEHIAGGVDRLLMFAAQRLGAGGLLYVEGPSPFMKLLPTNVQFRAMLGWTTLGGMILVTAGYWIVSA